MVATDYDDNNAAINQDATKLPASVWIRTVIRKNYATSMLIQVDIVRLMRYNRFPDMDCDDAGEGSAEGLKQIVMMIAHDLSGCPNWLGMVPTKIVTAQSYVMSIKMVMVSAH